MFMATNRADTLDPAFLRLGRLDQKFELPFPDRRQLCFGYSQMFFDRGKDEYEFVRKAGKLLSFGGCHIDVVTVNHVEWDFDPFPLNIDGDFRTHNIKGHEQIVTSILCHHVPHQLLLFSGSGDGKVRVWDLVTRKCIAALDKHFSSVISLVVSEDGRTLLSGGRDKVVNLWDLRNYSFKMTVPTYKMVATVCVIHPATYFYSSLGFNRTSGARKKKSSPPVIFLTVGECGVVRICNSEGAICLFEQGSSDVTISSDKEELKRGFMVVVLLPSDQGLLCLTADQIFLCYSLTKSDEEVSA